MTKDSTRLTKNGKRPEWRHKTIEQHIQESVFPCPNTGCWWWAGTIDKKTGYGQYSMDHKTVRAHRGMYEHFTGVKLTPTDILCHKCDNPLCVNPEHLYVGTHADNTRDKVSKNRQPKGETSGVAKLKETDVLEIRELIKLGLKDKDIALRYNVDRSAIYRIKVGDNWGWLHG